MNYDKLTDSAAAMRAAIEATCPPGRARSLAITKLDEAVLWASAAAAEATNGRTVGDDPLPPPPPPPPGD